ncbi:acyl-CoA-binding domain-containing protein 3-like isoform X2 [Humulus lupulus]|uniref:acyl-CoA-binding domain-containing protein 3-like isoform X2 n=1 Tax=Humulus lupulus TaxID=3486 RepID=UPI002B4128B2|nr:acyl-CoA-binding domain-containing protein 3-like isoform X2 [Humulus lupulus]
MELFLEFVSTILLTTLLCYIIGKLISSPPPTGDGELGFFECKFSVESDIRGLNSEERVGFVEKFCEVEESEAGLVLEKKSFAVQEFPDGEFGSSEIQNVLETEGEDENVVEEESYGEKGGINERTDDLFDGSSERDIIEEIEECMSTNDEVGLAKCDEIEVTEFDEVETNGADDAKGRLFDEEDDWVGVERTELERLFGAAMTYVGSSSNADRVSALSNDVKMKLYGLYKIATQGPCLDPQPMALNFFARAKWNAWQQLAEMTPEMAMERYISLLSESIPGWMEDESGGFTDACEFGKQDVLKTFAQNQPVAENERKLEELKPNH